MSEGYMGKGTRTSNSISRGRRRLLEAFATFAIAATSWCAKGDVARSRAVSCSDALAMLRARRATDRSIDEAVVKVLARVNKLMKMPLLTRAASLAQLVTPGTSRFGTLDSRAILMERTNAAEAKQFALAMADMGSTQKLFDELPTLAAAYVLTGDAQTLARITMQLKEVLTWRPLQRPGWSLFDDKSKLPADGNDGVWLATGMGLAALTTTLKLLPAGALEPSLRAAVVQQVAEEASRIMADWGGAVQWFVREHKPASNQWIVVAAAAVLASSVLPATRANAVREFGAARLLESLGVFGDEGAVSEGLIYGLNLDTPFLYLAAVAAVEAGDYRLREHPFLAKFPKWLAQQFQPAGSLVNCFDAYSAVRCGYPLISGNISLIAALSNDPEILWVKEQYFSHEFQSLDCFGLLALAATVSARRRPATSAAFKRGALVTWRSDWSQEASGVWLRGGHPLDTHDHNDRGHVSYIADGKLVLIEAGTPAYGDPEIETIFRSVKGHNVMQVGDEIHPRKLPAPMYIKHLGQGGGSVEIDAGQGYADVSSWNRAVEWDASGLKVVDTVSLTRDQPILFRWHFASEERLVISNDEQIDVTLPAGKIVLPGWIGNVPDNLDWKPEARDVLSTPAVKITVTANQRITAEEERDRDHALKFRLSNHRHTVLVVRSEVPIRDLIIKTLISKN